MKKQGKTHASTLLYLSIISLMAMGCGPKWTETSREDGINIVTNEGGQILGYSDSSGVQLLTVDRFAFKDLNKNGQLGRIPSKHPCGHSRIES